MAEFVYNNIKNTSISHTLFKFNYGYHFKVLFEENINLHSRFYSTDKLANKLKKLINIYCQNLLNVKKLQKKVHNKRIKSCSYALSKKNLVK